MPIYHVFIEKEEYNAKQLELLLSCLEYRWEVHCFCYILRVHSSTQKCCRWVSTPAWKCFQLIIPPCSFSDDIIREENEMQHAMPCHAFIMHVTSRYVTVTMPSMRQSLACQTHEHVYIIYRWTKEIEVTATHHTAIVYYKNELKHSKMSQCIYALLYLLERTMRKSFIFHAMLLWN